MGHDVEPGRVLLAAALAMALGGCARGCGGPQREGIGAPITSMTPPLRGVDCPDGLARCEAGSVTVSRVATLADPCHGRPGACECPWELLDDCPRGCAAEGVELVVDRSRALRQLCAPGPDAGGFAIALAPAPTSVTPSPAATAPSSGAPRTPEAPVACDEGDRYRCDKGAVVDCEAGVAVGHCASGCFADGTSIDDDGVSREAAFAILCSR